jgi:hypothetical protein
MWWILAASIRRLHGARLGERRQTRAGANFLATVVRYYFRRQSLFNWAATAEEAAKCTISARLSRWGSPEGYGGACSAADLDVGGA